MTSPRLQEVRRIYRENLAKTKRKPTPGPWSVSEGSPDIGIVTDEVLVAMVVQDEDFPCEPQAQMANARLIAAAPDLAQGYATILDRLATKPMQDDELADLCRAMIAKAKGK